MQLQVLQSWILYVYTRLVACSGDGIDEVIVRFGLQLESLAKSEFAHYVVLDKPTAIYHIQGSRPFIVAIIVIRGVQMPSHENVDMVKHY